MSLTVLFYFDHQINSFKGGTEKVSDLLAHHFKLKGLMVYYCARYREGITSDIETLFLPNQDFLLSPDNVSFIEKEVVEKQIDIIINQASNGEDVFLFNHQVLKVPVKIISTLHFSVLQGLDYFEELQLIEFCWLKPHLWIPNLLRLVKRPYNKRKAIKGKYNRFSFIYEYSDAVVTLSESYMEDFKRMAKLTETSKLYTIRNPLNYSRMRVGRKENRLLFVGRLSFPDKRLDRLLYIWKHLHKRFPGWYLDIVGDGDDRMRLEKLSCRLKLERVTFYGMQDPKIYYERSKIFCLTSTHEGLPMVLLEAMQNHVIPFAFSSFGAALDIITTGLNGFLIPPFEIEHYAFCLELLMKNPSALKQMSNRTKIGLGKYNIDNICDCWLHLFKQLK